MDSEKRIPELVSVVVPLYNEAGTVALLVERVAKVFDGLGCDAELVAVDDGSRDDTRARLLELGRKDARLRVVCLSRNFGLQGAVAAGLSEARGDVIVLMDGDLQDPPELIPELLDAWKSGGDVVSATKRSRKERGLRRLGFALFHKLHKRLTYIALPPTAGNFSLMDRRVLQVINGLSERNRFLPGLRAWVGFKQVEVPFDRDDRRAGAPGMTLRRLVSYALDGIFGFSYLPVRLMTVLGTIACLLGLGFMTWVLIARFVTHSAILGWPSLMLAICFIGGVQLVSLGILGEYIVRIYDEVRARPNYVVDRVVQVDGARDQSTKPQSDAS
jgi:polyisoprenyl-phosphate glycosyltransferase